MGIKETVNNPFSGWMDSNAPESDIAISSRVRVARNVASLPFPHMLSPQAAEDVICSVQLAVEKSRSGDSSGSLELVRMGELTTVERQVLVEKHLISPDLLENYSKKAVAASADEVVSVMINEEDHLRVQCILPGFQLEKAWGRVDAVDDALEENLDYAYDENLGYLTACPTNTGTGLRASVMLHLPGLVMISRVGDVLGSVAKLGMTVRGLYGEGTEASGDMFQISNQVTMGQTEEEIITALVSVCSQIIAAERTAREALLRERREYLEDRVGRSFGILKHARIMSSSEAIRLLSDLLLGVNLKIIGSVKASLITEIMVMTRPAMILKKAGAEMRSLAIDVQRAKIIRENLNKVTGGSIC